MEMGVTIFEALASLEFYFYARSIVRMALRRLTEKEHSSSNDFNREIGGGGGGGGTQLLIHRSADS